MSDHIIRAITADGSVKAVAITGRDLVERARTIHTLLPVATAALGRTLLAASMMGDMLKEDNGALTLQIKGGGPLGTILAVSDCGGNVRGYVQDPHVELMEKVPGKLDVGAAVGTDGSLTVIKDLGLKEPYIGSIGLFSGEIADDIAMYFVESEQIPTACALGVLVDRDQSVLAAGGYLIQLLPGAEEGLIDKIEAGVRRVGSVSHALSRGLDAQGLLEEVLSDFQLEVLETHPVEYRCSCSRERVSRALISMGREELSSLIAEQGQADLSCQFCDKVYHFSKEELEGLLPAFYLFSSMRYCSIKWEAVAPSAVAVTICRRGLVRTSPTAKTPGSPVRVVSSALIYPCSSSSTCPRKSSVSGTRPMATKMPSQASSRRAPVLTSSSTRPLTRLSRRSPTARLFHRIWIPLSFNASMYTFEARRVSRR